MLKTAGAAILRRAVHDRQRELPVSLVELSSYGATGYRIFRAMTFAGHRNIYYWVRAETAAQTLGDRTDMTETVMQFLLKRRSSKPALLQDPGPTAPQLEQILTAAARVPDHKKQVPWRFIVFEGAARARFGEKLAEICASEEVEPPSEIRLQTERDRFLRAPLVVAVISRITDPQKVPEIEQTLSAGAACMNLCHAANALGFGTSWITEWYAFSAGVRGVLGLADNESVAGFIYVGTASEAQPDRDRPDLAAITTHWQG